MDLIEIASWVALAAALAVVHMARSPQPVHRPASVIASAVIMALLGGFAARILHLSALRVGGYSLSALFLAAALAEIDVWMKLREHLTR